MWYEMCKSREAQHAFDIKPFEKVNILYEKLNVDGTFKEGFRAEIAEIVRTELSKAEGDQSMETFKDSVATSLTTATALGNNVYSNMVCKKCGTSVGLLVGSDKCPNCKSQIAA